MLKIYQFLIKYKHWETNITDPSLDGVSFVQKGMKNNNYPHDDNWQKSDIFHECGNKGHIITNSPNTIREENGDK